MRLEAFNLFNNAADRTHFGASTVLPLLDYGLGTEAGAQSAANVERASNVLDALRRTARGSVVLEGVPKNWFGPIAASPIQPPEPTALTDREVEVLHAAAEGLTARQIGTRLGVSERTVTTHLSRIYKKLGASGRIAAITAAADRSVAAGMSSRPVRALHPVSPRPHRPRSA